MVKKPDKITDNIDINCDLGEGETIADCEKDALLMPYISSCNIACGGHAGNQSTIATSLANAAKHQLKIGAHPGYADKNNFGRVSLELPIQELKDSLKQQINSFNKQADKQNIKLHHIKFHGALYNDIEADNQLALELATVCKKYFPSLELLGLADGNLEEACKKLNINFIKEGFMDRTYLSNGKLTPRGSQNAVIENRDEVVKQAIALASNQFVTTNTHNQLKIKVDSICLHGDNPNALAIAEFVCRAMQEHGLQLK
jgi:UPF0271 protein